MDYRIMNPAERKYTFRQSQQISMQTGLIGYLRADFGSTGKEFYSTWNDFRKDLKTDDFKNLVASLAKHVAKKNPASVEDMMAQSFSEDESKTVSDVINGAVAKIGEKITIRRFNRVEGIVDTYVHLGGKIGVLLQISNNEFPAVAHDVAMQIAAAKPTCLRKEDCDQAELEHEREILREQAKNDPKPKPAAIIEKMVEGRIEKYYKEVCLLEQPFVKNPDESVSQMINGRFEVIGFTRYEMGEGLQKRTEDFAAEVMAQTKKA